MTIAHDAIAALPTAGGANHALIRSMATKRFAYCLSASENVTGFVAVDPDTGALPLYLIQNNILFQYDSTDSTTVNDGVTCLVTSDGKRYKAATIAYPWAVLSYATSAQPVSPSVGDSYLLPIASTGAQWSGKDGDVAIYTAAGWQFAVVPIGRGLYVRDVDARYYRNASGTWTRGIGTLPYSAATIPTASIIGMAGTLIRKVENQTTNTPPISPALGVAYIIGSSPTGAWSGNAGKLAVCDVAGAFVIFTPTDGDIVYDKALKLNYSWSTTFSAWVSALGQMKCVLRPYGINGTFSKNARCVGVRVTVVGGGGGSGGAGGTTSFGAHCSATGGASSINGTGGLGSGGDENLRGYPGTITVAGDVFNGHAPSEYASGDWGLGGGGSGGGGASIAWLLASALSTNEVVTVGAAGVGGGSGAGGTAGQVMVEEWILI